MFRALGRFEERGESIALNLIVMYTFDGKTRFGNIWECFLQKSLNISLELKKKFLYKTIATAKGEVKIEESTQNV